MSWLVSAGMCVECGCPVAVLAAHPASPALSTVAPEGLSVRAQGQSFYCRAIGVWPRLFAAGRLLLAPHRCHLLLSPLSTPLRKPQICFAPELSPVLRHGLKDFCPLIEFSKRVKDFNFALQPRVLQLGQEMLFVFSYMYVCVCIQN